MEFCIFCWNGCGPVVVGLPWLASHSHFHCMLDCHIGKIAEIKRQWSLTLACLCPKRQRGADSKALEGSVEKLPEPASNKTGPHLRWNLMVPPRRSKKGARNAKGTHSTPGAAKRGADRAQQQWRGGGAWRGGGRCPAADGGQGAVWRREPPPRRTDIRRERTKKTEKRRQRRGIS